MLKTDVRTEVERLEEKDTVLLTVEVPADVFGKALDQAYKRVAAQISIPGFRKGKVPKNIIDSRVGKEAVQQEAIEKNLPLYYVDSVKESQIEPIDQPEVDVVQVEEGKPLIFTAKVKVKPEVKLGDYKGVAVTKPSAEPTEEEMAERIEQLRANFADLEPVEDRPVQQGDFVLINFEGFINDQPFEGGSANDYLLEIGSGQFIPGFEEQLIEMKKGEIRDVMVTFPEGYQSEELAGKEAKFKVLLKEIKERKLPEVNDEFAKQIGFDTLEELRKDVSDKIRTVTERYSEAAVRGEVVGQAAENAEVEIPDVMIEHELDDMMEEFADDVRRQGFEPHQYFEITGTDPAKLREDWRDRARDRVVNRLVLEAVAKAEKIEVTDEDVDNEIRKAADQAGRSFDEVKQIFTARGTIDTLKQRMLLDKTITWLVDNAEVKEEEPPTGEAEETKKEKPKKKKEDQQPAESAEAAEPMEAVEATEEKSQEGEGTVE